MDFRQWISEGRFVRIASVSLAFLLPAVTEAGFTNLGPAGDFNVFVFNDFTQTGSDAWGRVAVGHNATFKSYSIASHLGSGIDNLIVGGNYSNVSNTLNGGMIVDGNVTWSNPSISGRVVVNGDADFGGGGGNIAGSVNVFGNYQAPFWFPSNTNSGSPTPLPFSFSTVQTYLTNASDHLASLAPNGTTTISYNQVHLTANSPSSTFVSFAVTAAQLAAAAGHGLSIAAPAGSTVVVNISGAVASFRSMGINLTGVDNQHVLYNFVDATSLTIEGIGVEGTVLAPQATVNFNSGNINGTMIAKNLTGTGEAHQYLFQGHLPPTPTVPEPSTLLLGMLGLLGFGGGWGVRCWKARGGVAASLPRECGTPDF